MWDFYPLKLQSMQVLKKQIQMMHEIFVEIHILLQEHLIYKGTASDSFWRFFFLILHYTAIGTIECERKKIWFFYS